MTMNVTMTATMIYSHLNLPANGQAVIILAIFLEVFIAMTVTMTFHSMQTWTIFVPNPDTPRGHIGVVTLVRNITGSSCEPIKLASVVIRRVKNSRVVPPAFCRLVEL